MPTAPKASAIFHLAAPIQDKEETRRFYQDLLGCRAGREAERWIDFDFFGHQVSFHIVDRQSGDEPTNQVDGKDVPVRHFGAILDWGEWHDLSARLQAVGTEFIIEPYIRFEGQIGEQATMFFLDPSGNALEFKSFKDKSQIFEI